jgi:hypothetical protein
MARAVARVMKRILAVYTSDFFAVGRIAGDLRVSVKKRCDAK